MLVVSHTKVEVSLAKELNTRRLTQVLIEVAKFFFRTVAKMHVTERKRGPRGTVFSDESREIVHVYDARVKVELLQSRDDGIFSKNAPGGDTARQFKLEIEYQVPGCGHAQESFGDLLTEAETTGQMLAYVSSHLLTLMNLHFFKRISLQILLMLHNAKTQNRQPF